MKHHLEQRIAFALAAYVTAYGLVGPQEGDRGIHSKPTNRLIQWGIKLGTAMLRLGLKAQRLPNWLYTRYVTTRIRLFGWRLRDGSRDRKLTNTMGILRRATILAVSRASLTFDRTIPIASLGNLPTVANNLSAAGGGSIYVSGTGTFHASSTIALAASGAISGVDVWFSPGAVVQIDAAQDLTNLKRFAIPSGVGGTKIWVMLFELANCTDVNFYNADCVSNVPAATSSLVNCFHVGGNATSVHFYDCSTTGFTRWGYWSTCYVSGGAEGTQDGNIVDLRIFRASGSNLGNLVVAGGDGGLCKIGNQSLTGATIKHVELSGSYATNLHFAGFDTNVASPGIVQSGAGVTVGPLYFAGQDINEDFKVLDNTFVMDSDTTKAKYGVFLESHAATSQLIAVRTIKVRGNHIDMNGGGTANGAGVHVSNANSDVLVDGNTVKNPNPANSQGYVLTAGGGAGATANFNGTAVDVGHGYRYRNNVSIGGAIGFLINVTAGGANSVLEDLLIDGHTCDDAGFGGLTTGLKVQTSATKYLRNATIRKFDVTNIASGGTPLSNSIVNDVCSNLRFQDCPGIAPMGLLANAIKDLAFNVIAPAPDAAAIAPTSAAVYNVAAKNGITVAATNAGTITAYSATDGRAFPLRAFSEISNQAGTGAAAASTTYTCIGDTASSGVFEDYTITVAVGSSASLNIVVQDFAGNYLNPSGAAGDATITSLVVPRGSTINLGAFTGTPTVTVVGSTSGTIANPFVTGNRSFAATYIPFGGQYTVTYSGTPVWTTQMSAGPTAGFTTIASPFGNNRLAGIVSTGGATVTTAKTYKATGTDLRFNITWPAGTTQTMAVIDEYGNTVTNPTVTSASTYTLDVPVGCFIKFSWASGAPTLAVSGVT